MKKQNKNTRTRDLNQPLLKTEVLVSTICTRLHNGDETASPECRDPRRGENVEAADEEKVVGGLYIQVRQIRPTMLLSSLAPASTSSVSATHGQPLYCEPRRQMWAHILPREVLFPSFDTSCKPRLSLLLLISRE